MIKAIQHIHDTGAYRYAADVLDGKVPVGEFITLAARRFMRDIERDDIYMDLDEARKIVNFASICKHWKGSFAGQPIELLPHQQFYFQQMFGWKRTETGHRRFKRSAKLVARKNGKTTEMAVQGMYHSLIDEKHGPQVWIGATKKDQAKICLKDIAQIIKKSPELKEDFRIFWNKDKPTEILCKPSDGLMSVIGRDSDTEDGLDVSMSIIDEWHAHKDTSVRDILSSAMGNRMQPIESIISTAGFNMQGPCYTKTRKVGIDILHGIKEDDEQLIIFYEIDQDRWDEWENPELWVHANPNLDASPTIRNVIQSNYTTAKNEGGSTEVNFKTKHLNIWTYSAETWIKHDLLIRNTHGITLEELRGKECYIGLDLSSGKDLNAEALFFPNARPGIHALYIRFWIPEVKIIEQQDEVDYHKWEKEGHITKFPGSIVAYSKIAEQIIQDIEDFDVKIIGADSKYLYTGPVEAISRAGYEGLVVAVGQGFNLTAATETIERWVMAGELDLFDNPVTIWNFSNVVLHEGESGHKYPGKKKSIGKIDGVSAGVTAVEEYLRLGAEPAAEESTIEIWN